MPRPVLPDAEKLTIDYLIADTDVSAETSDRVYSRKPSDLAADVLYVTCRRLGGTKPVPRRLDSARIQIDVWGGTEFTAHRAARVINAAMWEMHKASHTGAVVTGVEEEVGIAFLPDPVDPGKTQKPRYTQTFSVFAHPTP